jgi:arylsulfatase A-like enzyme
VKRLILLFASLGVAIAIVGLVVAGDELLIENQRADAQTATRPNFVFVMTDDLDELSMKQLHGIQTIMGDHGTTFENAFVTYALCCPSRATFFRGQYPHNHGVTSDKSTEGEPKFRQLRRDESTVATWLNESGYQTKYLGKYLNGYRGPYIPPGWDEWYALQGSVENNVVNDGGQSVQLTRNSTDVFADEASDFIRRSSVNPDPFFVMVGTRAPHRTRGGSDPIGPEVPDRYLNSFADAPLPRPLNFDEADVSDKPRWVKSFPRLTQAQIDEEQTLYRQRLRSMLPVEDLLRQVIATLEETGELNYTYIFFTSDNGFHQGQHRLAPGDKKTPYEEDIGVPLIVRGPGVPADAVRQELVINNDFAPTIADLAGASTPAFVDGSSFAPLLSTSPPSPWRRAFLEEGWLPATIAVPTHKGVHTLDHMFVEYDTGERELYDLRLDPYQLQSKPRVGNESLYSELQTRLDSLRACSGIDCRAAEGFPDTTMPPPPTDPGPPTVVSTFPTPNETGVAPAIDIEATFSEDVDGSSITPNTFKLFKKGSTTKIAAAEPTYDAATKTATLDPTNPLRAGATYKAVVTTGVKDVAGNPLDQNGSTAGSQQKAWLFTVR